jgi:hypothetical protein
MNMKRYAIIATSYTHVTEPVGMGKFKGQCAALVQHFGCHVTNSWRRGAPVKGNNKIREGTCIATFEGNLYPGRDHGNHAAIYIRQTDKELFVYDQWKGKKPAERPLEFKKNMSDPSNNGNCFSVILTPVFTQAAGYEHTELADNPVPEVIRYEMEDMITDASVKKALRKALSNDGAISYEEVKALIRSTRDGKVTRHELADLQIILDHSQTIDARSRELIEQFLKNPHGAGRH